MIEKLKSQHRLTRDYTDELLALVDRDTPCDLDVLSECRWRLARLMLQHYALEQRYVFRPLEEDPRPEVKLAALSFKMELEANHARYEEYLNHWTRRRIILEWPVYAASVRHMVAYALDKMEREEAELYPLIRTRLNAGIRRPTDRNWAGEGQAIRGRILRAA